MSALAGGAADGDVILLHENEKEIYGDIPRRCVEILEGVGSPNLRAAWDAANFVQVGVRPYTEGYAAIRPYLEYVQIKDAHLANGEVVPAGRGDGEVMQTIRTLREDGYDGFCPWNRTCPRPTVWAASPVRICSPRRGRRSPICSRPKASPTDEAPVGRPPTEPPA